MLKEYARNYYAPASQRGARLTANGYAGARELAAHIDRVSKHWNEIEFGEVTASDDSDLTVGSIMTVTTNVALGSLNRDDVRVELCHGRMNSGGRLVDYKQTAMRLAGESDGVAHFRGDVECESSGQRGYAVRVVPNHPLLGSGIIPNLMRWA